MKIEINEYKINADIPCPVTLAFVSDLHGTNNRPITEHLKAMSPHGVLVGGDFIHSENCFQSGIEFIEEISKLFPTFVSLGNHETAMCGIDDAVKKTDAVLLDNSDTEFQNIRIGGLTSAYFYESLVPDTKWLEEFSQKDKFKILLCHHPECYEKYIRKTFVDLTLSGHAHGGQWRIFDKGIYAPGQGLFPKYTSGMYDGRLIVGRGLGNKVCVPRINNRPEIILLNIC